MAIVDPLWLTYKALKDHLDWSNAAIYGLLLLGSWLLYKCILKPLLSPLRKIPGLPFNPLLGNFPTSMKGEAMEAILKMIEKYGPVFRYYVMFGQTRLGLADPEVIRHVTVTNSRNYIKPPRKVSWLKTVLGNGLLTSEGATHASHKRLMSPAFNNQSIKKMVPVFEKRFLNLVEYWKRKIDNGGSAEVNVSDDISRTTLDIIGETAFGFEFNGLEHPDSEVENAFREIASGALFSYWYFIPFYLYLPFPEVLMVKRNLKIVDSVVSSIIRNKRELLSKGIDRYVVEKDVLGMMMTARDVATGEGLSDQELRDDVVTLMFAGHEATAVAICWCLLMLASHQEVQEKARQEIQSQLNDDEPLTVENLEKLNFLAGIVKETLRLLPPAPITLREAVKADVLPGDIQVPAGTIMTLYLGPMMRRAEIYEDPDAFRPERFEEKETEATFHHFLPFLIGPRMCLGYKFAFMELRVALVMLLRHFHFDVIPDIKFRRKITVTMKPDPPMTLRVSRTRL